MIKKFLKKIEWWFDYYIAWFMYNGKKRDRYIEYMENKWNKQNKDEF